MGGDDAHEMLEVLQRTVQLEAKGTKAAEHVYPGGSDVQPGDLIASSTS